MPATGTYLPSWNSTPITATEWADDPCPDSWRLPTQEELQALISSGGSYAWYDMPAPYWRGNAVNGMFFGSRHTECSLPDDMVGCIFLPASGGRQYNSFPLPGKLYYSNSIGYYWSSTQHSTIATAAHGITFDETDSFAASSGNKLSGYNIRCVYDPKAVSNPTTQSMSTNSVAQAETSSAAQTDSYKAAQAESYSPTPKEPFISMLDTVNAMSKADRAALISTIQAKLSHNTSATPAKTDMPTTLISKAELATATLYPNPVVNGQLTIDNGELAIGMEEVINSNGMVVRTQDFGSQTTGTLRLQGLQGTYFIRMGKSTQSIVVTK